VSLWDTPQFRIPRRGIPDSAASLQLHVFVDASKDAYAAALYVRAELGGSVTSRLFFGKSRLKPRSVVVTIPRMELLAMLIGARVLCFAEKQLRAPVAAKFLWGDSMPVLRWVGSKEIQPRFVENRLREIRSISDGVRS